MVSTTSALAAPMLLGNAASTDLARRVPINVGYLAYLRAANEPGFECTRPMICSVVPRIVQPRPTDPGASPICFIEVEQSAVSPSPFVVLGEAAEPERNAACSADIAEDESTPTDLASPPRLSNTVENDTNSRVDTLIETIRAISRDLSRNLPRVAVK